MKTKKKMPIRKQQRRARRSTSKREELVVITGQLIVTTLIISFIALYAASVGIESTDFWEVIRVAITLQSTLQGMRLLNAASKKR